MSRPSSVSLFKKRDGDQIISSMGSAQIMIFHSVNGKEKDAPVVGEKTSQSFHSVTDECNAVYQNGLRMEKDKLSMI